MSEQPFHLIVTGVLRSTHHPATFTTKSSSSICC